MMTAEEITWWNALLATSNPGVPPRRVAIPRHELTKAQKKGHLLPHEQPELIWITPCPLLTLPRELRDTIWTYVLNHDGGLSGYLNKSNNTIEFHARDTIQFPRSKFNKLQFVNKQVREETRGMALKNNDLWFDKRDLKPMDRRVERLGVCNIDVASRFISECSPTLKASLRKVTATWGQRVLRGEDNNGPAMAHPNDVFSVIKDNSPLSLFCREYPKATVLLRFRIIDNASANYYTWIYKMLAWQMALRGCTNIRVPQQCLQDLKNDFADRLEILEGSKLVKSLPRNLRISIMDRWEDGTKQEGVDKFGWETLPGAREVLEDAEKAFLEGL